MLRAMNKKIFFLFNNISILYLNCICYHTVHLPVYIIVYCGFMFKVIVVVFSLFNISNRYTTDAFIIHPLFYWILNIIKVDI